MILAIEGGATHSRLGAYSEEGSLIREAEGGPANPVASGVDGAVRAIASAAGPLLGAGSGPLTVLAGLAGAIDPAVQAGMAAGLAGALGAVRVLVTTDLHPLLFANTGPGDGVLVVAGTGSAVLARNRKGRVLRLGGRGAVFGDEGSAYRLAVDGLRAACAQMDGLGPETSLLAALPVAAGMNNLDDLAAWAGRAAKRDIAALAMTVAEEAEAGDFVARACIDEQSRRLAAQAVAAAEKLFLEPGTRFFLHGSLLTECIRYREAFGAAVDQYFDAQLMDCAHQGHAAVFHALRGLPQAPWIYLWEGQAPVAAGPPLPPTESALHAGPTLDQLDALGIVQHMNRLDGELAGAVASQARVIAQVVETAARCIAAGGRIIYAGAGTSGRLGVLDASECPPTFGVPPERVVGLIAGGDRALRESIEGEEDNREAAVNDLARLNPTVHDLVVGIAASGSTPYVAAMLHSARQRGCYTALVCCHPQPRAEADFLVCLDTGPEALTGSTRLKAGTATKMVLNMISTGAMALSGYVHDGLMVEMRPSNEKLRRRAARIVAQVAGCDEAAAWPALEASNWSIPVAIALRMGVAADADSARAWLAERDGRVKDILRASHSKSR